MGHDPAATHSDLEVIRAVIASELREVHKTVVAKVVKYDAAKQRADVQPVMRAPVTDETGEDVFQEHPVIPNVPVRFPGGKGFIILWPLEPGDFVDLHFQDEDHSTWRVTGQTSDPLVLDRHGMFAYCTPGARPDVSPNADGADSDTRLIIGREGGTLQIRIDSTHIELGKAPADWVALANLVNARFATLEGHVNAIRQAYNGHTHAETGTTTSAPDAGQQVGAMGAVSSVASTVVKCA
jgi:hypothetical protein